MDIVVRAIILLGAAITMVPLFRRLNLGAVLGYLAAGMLVGPWILGLYGDSQQLFHIGELGIVLLFFVIGLELHPRRLWLMRKSIFGLGGGQMLLCASPIALVGYLAGMTPIEAAVVGAGLAFSSTPFALQLLSERNQLATRYSREAFSILLFQDLAVIPLLALIPVFGVSGADSGNTSPLAAALRALVLLGVIIVLGRYLLHFALRIVARAAVSELFTAMALFTVALMALIAKLAGLSMALGGFLAGVLLADSEYRHALEADLDPFKGLLLGLFFMSVGMTADLGLFVQKPLLILLLAIGLILLKSLIIFGLMRLKGLDGTASGNGASVLSQGGEFAFVLFAAAIPAGLMDRAWLDLMVAVIILSMALTPPFFAVMARRDSREHKKEERPFEPPEQPESRVIIAGFGRFGQVVARILRARRIPFTALESNSDQVDLATRFGNKVHYGDPTRLELLRAARVDQARVFVLAVDQVTASLSIVRTVRRHFPGVTIFARARDRQHAYQLMELGVEHIYRETFYSSIALTSEMLTRLGLSHTEARHVTERFREHDERRLRAGFGNHDDLEKMIELTKESERELETLLEQDDIEQ